MIPFIMLMLALSRRLDIILGFDVGVSGRSCVLIAEVHDDIVTAQALQERAFTQEEERKKKKKKNTRDRSSDLLL